MAFQLIELVLITVVLMIVALLVTSSIQSWKRKASPIRCTNQLKNIGLAARIFATDNDDLMPGTYLLTNNFNPASLTAAIYFQTLSNELSKPWLVRCPEDKSRKAAVSFTDMGSQNISYFASLTAQESLSNVFLAGDRTLQTDQLMESPGLFPLTTNRPLAWSKEVHKGEGNIVTADGSVQHLVTSSLGPAVSAQGVSTNFLLFP